MVGPATEMGIPEALLPESEAIHLLAAVAERGVGVGRAVEVELHELFQVSPDNLVCIDKDDAVQAEREEDIEEQDLVRPCLLYTSDAADD